MSLTIAPDGSLVTTVHACWKDAQGRTYCVRASRPGWLLFGRETLRKVDPTAICESNSEYIFMLANRKQAESFSDALMAQFDRDDRIIFDNLRALYNQKSGRFADGRREGKSK